MEEPMANSSRLVLPIKTAPLCLSFATTLASYLGIKSSRICDPHVVLIPLVHKRSFKAMGIPVKAELTGLDIPAGSEAEQNINQVIRAGKRATDVVKQILTFSRQSGREKQPLRVDRIVKEVMKLMRATLPASIEIHQDIEKDAGIVEANSTQIFQVLMNLCTNAHHEMRDEGGILEVSLTNVDMDSDVLRQYPDFSPGPYLRLCVSDTGHGMYPEVKERIFEPFFTTKNTGQGTGLSCLMK